MKFSSKLFKIQAKMSLPAFVLMGSVCHLGAMEDELDSFSAQDFGSISTPIKDPRLSDVSNVSDGSVTPNSPVITRRSKKGDSVNSDAAGFVRPKGCGEAVSKESHDLLSPEFEYNFKARSSMAFSRPGLLGRGRGAGRLAGRETNARRTSSVQKEASPAQGSSPLVSYPAVYSPGLPEGVSPGFLRGDNPLAATEGKGLRGSPVEKAVADVLDAAIERNSPQKVVGNKLRAAVMHDASNAATMVLRAERLEFGDSDDAGGSMILQSDQVGSLNQELELYLARLGRNSVLTATDDASLVKIDFGGDIGQKEMSWGNLKAKTDTEAATDTVYDVSDYVKFHLGGKHRQDVVDSYDEQPEEELLKTLQDQALASVGNLPTLIGDLALKAEMLRVSHEQVLHAYLMQAEYIKKLERQNNHMRKLAAGVQHAFTSQGYEIVGKKLPHDMNRIAYIEEENLMLTRAHEQKRASYAKLLKDSQEVEELYALQRERDRQAISAKEDENRLLRLKIEELERANSGNAASSQLKKQISQESARVVSGRTASVPSKKHVEGSKSDGRVALGDAASVQLKKKASVSGAINNV